MTFKQKLWILLWLVATISFYSSVALIYTGFIIYKNRFIDIGFSFLGLFIISIIGWLINLKKMPSNEIL